MDADARKKNMIEEQREHTLRHQQLHAMLDELVANFIQHTGKLPSSTTVMELMIWVA